MGCVTGLLFLLFGWQSEEGTYYPGLLLCEGTCRPGLPLRQDAGKEDIHGLVLRELVRCDVRLGLRRTAQLLPRTASTPLLDASVAMLFGGVDLGLGARRRRDEASLQGLR